MNVYCTCAYIGPYNTHSHTNNNSNNKKTVSIYFFLLQIVKHYHTNRNCVRESFVYDIFLLLNFILSPQCLISLPNRNTQNRDASKQKPEKKDSTK